MADELWLDDGTVVDVRGAAQLRHDCAVLRASRNSRVRYREKHSSVFIFTVRTRKNVTWQDSAGLPGIL